MMATAATATTTAERRSNPKLAQQFSVGENAIYETLGSSQTPALSTQLLHTNCSAGERTGGLGMESRWRPTQIEFLAGWLGGRRTEWERRVNGGDEKNVVYTRLFASERFHTPAIGGAMAARLLRRRQVEDIVRKADKLLGPIRLMRDFLGRPMAPVAWPWWQIKLIPAFGSRTTKSGGGEVCGGR
jgi:hypothetical protein